MKVRLQEVSRSQELATSRGADDYAPDNRQYGRNRVQRRLKSKIAPSVKEYNQINMNKLFKEDILDVTLKVQGETDTYLTRISFGGILDKLSKTVKPEGKLEARDVTRALIAAFNSDHVYLRCNCPDFKYRQAYWMTKAGAIAGDPETIPSDETNPNDSKGRGCKHIMLVLANNSWLIKVSSVITNYVNYMEEHYPKLYAEVIYPALYKQEYKEPYQLDIDTIDSDDLKTSEQDIDNSNAWARTKNQFKPGNTQGIRFAPEKPDEVPGQVDFDSLVSD